MWLCVCVVCLRNFINIIKQWQTYMTMSLVESIVHEGTERNLIFIIRQSFCFLGVAIPDMNISFFIAKPFDSGPFLQYFWNSSLQFGVIWLKLKLIVWHQSRTIRILHASLKVTFEGRVFKTFMYICNLYNFSLYI